MFHFGLKKSQLSVKLAILIVLGFSIHLHWCYPHGQDGSYSTEAEENLENEDDQELIDDDDDDYYWEDVEEEITDTENTPLHGYHCKKKNKRCTHDGECCFPLKCRKHIFHKKCKHM